MRKSPFFVVAVVLAGCGQAETYVAAAARDSAGVRIVGQGRLNALPAAPFPQPVFRIGWTDESVTFGDIGAGTLLSDGSAAVIDESASSLILISRDGAVRATAGGPGDGPGEFRGASSLTSLPGDTLVVYDRRLSRLSRFDSQVASLIPECGCNKEASPRHPRARPHLNASRGSRPALRHAGTRNLGRCSSTDG